MTEVIRALLTTSAPLDPLAGTIISLYLPEGFGRLLSGRARQGDLYLNQRDALRVEDGKRVITWLPATPGEPVEAYACLVRPGVPSEPCCERCRCEPRRRRNRYCTLCGFIVLEEQRRR